MREYKAESYDVVVIGAGHAGIEASLAAARLGIKTAVFTINMDSVGNLPCNPSIGGTAKGHLVREVDALGGQMALAADACTIQSRMLNRGKGPAVHSLRAQIDRRAYAASMKKTLERQPNLDLRQAEITGIRKCGEGNWECVTKLGAVHAAKAVILATGTFLGGKIYVGEISYNGGPDGLFAANQLTGSLAALGVPLRRFKTGTPARVNRRSVDLDVLERQEGEDPITPFSFETAGPLRNKEVCHITWTNAETRRVILDNLERAPHYSGKYSFVGTRYCPSIEDKMVRFADKDRHQIFIEPCGLDTEELYLQGISSSLPEEIQLRLLRTIKGLEHVQMMRTAYAIEYDSVDPLSLYPTLEFMDLPGLYGAGQFNGSSGYEEAAAQGLMAGINAALKILGRPPFVLDRATSYIGTLIDDLVTKGVSDPYRMMTSRSEYRLILRQDNADERLTPLGYGIGLISKERWERFLQKQQQKKQEIKRLRDTIVSPKAANALLGNCGTAPLVTGARLIDLMKRPELGYRNMTDLDVNRPPLSPDIMEACEVEIKYEGYIRRQQAQIDEMRRLENRKLPEDVDYTAIGGLRLEAKEKLGKIRPISLGQASRISGVSPADISVLLIWLSRQ